MTVDVKDIATLPLTIREASEVYRTKLPIGHEKTCACKPNHLNCMTAKAWIKSQIGVWQFNYEGRDVRDKKLHPATFPISLAWAMSNVEPCVLTQNTPCPATATKRRAFIHG